jgi:hypothetical protein
MSLRSLFSRRPRPAPPLAWPDPFVPEETAEVSTAETGRVLAALAALRRAMPPMPTAFTGVIVEQRPWVPQEERFDAGRYFAAFDRLHPEEGWALDYVYHYWGNGGSPLLYARRAGDPPIMTPEAYREIYPWADSQPPYLARLAAERSPEGAFQLALFALEAPKFYLCWHSNYFDLELVCTPERREELLAGIPEESHFFIQGIDGPARERLRAVPLAPVVRRAGDFAEVETVAFTKWGGFSRRTARLAFPNRQLAVLEEELVPYQCGIMY